ncbi:sn-glycerol-3-phosphate ABC transporter ATP-binding protein UgpC [Inquilinus sp. CAU 1745]|uniref:ABC transporter ATP-binding protein n=1 Tax=Inquilinus sp. CAU 1745 TaxID=3140369 RepID=UPI00325C3339
MANVVLRDVVKKYGDLQVIHGVDLEIEAEELAVFVGPSGCGKSTLLRMIAGLEEISGGEIEIGGRTVNALPPRHRDIAMVFQDYALYPHMSVRENMGFGLKMRKASAGDIVRRVDEAADILQIGHLLDRKPRELSGGQRQRVAMGRAIVRDPVAFLFDEPLSNLDAKLRTEMRTEIKKLHDKLRATIIYVTHDQVEAMTLADRIVVLRDGVIEQVGTPDDIYNRPANKFVAGFTGSPPMNFAACRLTEDGGGLRLDFGESGGLPVPPEREEACRAHIGRPLLFGIRPEHLAPGREGDLSTLSLPVQVIEPLGSDTLAFLDLGGHDVIARLPPESAPRTGDRFPIAFAMDRFYLFDPDSEKSLAIGSP